MKRFNDAETAAIFELAAKAHQPSQARLSSTEGLTLVQLQDIGREVGITPDAIAQAADMVARGGRPALRTFMGLPLGVERTVDLGRRLSDEEWERLVVDLRETFEARGTMRSEGSLRAWTNGNLHALLEPTANGYRIRLRTVKGGARGQLVGGLGVLGVAVAMLSTAVLAGAVGDTGMLAAMGFMAAAGATMFATTAARLPGWARLRRQQMEDLAHRLVPQTTPSLETANDSSDRRKLTE